MRFAVLIAIASSACDLIYPLEFVDEVPHIPVDAEAPGELDLLIPAGELVILDTTSRVLITGSLGDAVLEPVRQDGTDADVTVMRVRDFTVAGTFAIQGDLPLIIIANTILVTGTIDASAVGFRPGPGGSGSGNVIKGNGVAGITDGGFDGSATGGGGGGFTSGAGVSGRVDCPTPLDAAGAGVEIGDPVLRILHGGGAGGRGGTKCPDMITDGGGGGGALQLSARTTISILGGGGVFAGGGGGVGGLSTPLCPAGNGDGGGGGGGAGGAIYFDAPALTNIGTIAATGGGGGGGGNGTMAVGQNGKDARDPLMPSKGGGGSGKGTFGGDGATAGVASSGENGSCVNTTSFNTGGGGGALGRIVFRTEVKVDPIGNVNPKPHELERISEAH